MESTNIETRFENMEATLRDLKCVVNGHTEALGRVEQKVFNGFGTKIDNTYTIMALDRASNEKAHTGMEKSLSSIIKFGATSFILIFIALLGIIGSLWLRTDCPINVKETHYETATESVK